MRFGFDTSLVPQILPKCAQVFLIEESARVQLSKCSESVWKDAATASRTFALRVFL